MKYTFTILGIILVVILVLFVLLNNKLLSDSSSNIEKVIVNCNIINGETVVLSKGQKEIEEFVKVLSQTKKIRRISFPNHTESIQSDSTFKIEIIYENGLSDIISFSENKRMIYRFLNTTGSSGDQGYIVGNNPFLYDFIEQELF